MDKAVLSITFGNNRQFSTTIDLTNNRYVFGLKYTDEQKSCLSITFTSDSLDFST